MDMEKLSEEAREELSREEKNELLYWKQKAMLEEFLERGAISRAQFEKSMHDLAGKTGHAEV
ncbi:MAG: hypothetical protein II971_03670 [Firmicutes bacterium]|nr:hypothetical protein [Bacillota bacterium]